MKNICHKVIVNHNSTVFNGWLMRLLLTKLKVDNEVDMQFWDPHHCHMLIELMRTLRDMITLRIWYKSEKGAK